MKEGERKGGSNGQAGRERDAAGSRGGVCAGEREALGKKWTRGKTGSLFEKEKETSRAGLVASCLSMFLDSWESPAAAQKLPWRSPRAHVFFLSKLHSFLRIRKCEDLQRTQDLVSFRPTRPTKERRKA